MRRSLHFVPGGNEKMIAKALTLPADGLILDLEDAVTPDRKAATRPVVRRWLETLDFGGRERWVRMNPVFTDYAEADLAETIGGRPDGYVVPKPRRAEDVRRVAAMPEWLLQRLEAKGYVTSDKSDLAHVFRAAVSRDKLLRQRLRLGPW